MGGLRRLGNLLCLAVIMALGWTGAAEAQSGATARIGVLAFRGKDTARSEWTPLATYLSDTIDGWQFEIVPVTLVSAPQKIRNNELEFLITNPGHYIALAEQFGLSALATRERRTEGDAAGLLRYGTVIFSLKTSGFQALDDLKGKRLAAVSPDAFGGFQLAWQEFRRQDIDAFSDLETIRFMGFPQDAIVMAVQDGEVDAGVVRSGLLENLDAEGRIEIADFTVLQGNSQLGYPHLVSGGLYPEWPFTALPGIDKKLRERVAAALLATQDPAVAKAYALGDVWSAALSYEDVRVLGRAYHQREAASGGLQRFGNIPLLLTILLLGAVIFALARVVSGKFSQGQAATTEVDDPQADPETEAAIQRFESLTNREREILMLICTGDPSKTIAEKLGISPKTVEYHRANLLQKTDAGTTAHLVQQATRLGFDQGFSLGGSA